jgi:hypothetical protein
MIFRPLLEPGLFRSYHGGLPQQIQQSPASEIDTIYEENETIELSETKSIRYLTPINTFSILSNRIHPQDSSTNKLNKTFIKLQSATDDENFISTKSLNTFSIDKNLFGIDQDEFKFEILLFYRFGTRRYNYLYRINFHFNQFDHAQTCNSFYFFLNNKGINAIMKIEIFTFCFLSD